MPEEVAVLGVNDDELICELANPPLSSVIQNCAADWVRGGGDAGPADVGEEG